MNSSLLIPILVIVVAAFVSALLKSGNGKQRTGAYKQRKLMTDNEEEFFGRLIVALPDHYVFPQVALSALLDTASGNRRTAHADRLRIAQQRADYVVCSRNCAVVAVIELDDRTHSRAKDQLRDARLQQAGIRTVRFQSHAKPSADAIRATVLQTPMAGLGNNRGNSSNAPAKVGIVEIAPSSKAATTGDRLKF